METVKRCFVALPQPVIVVDRQNRLLWMNPHAEALNGMRLKDVRGLPSAQLWPFLSSQERNIAKVRTTGKPQTLLTSGGVGAAAGRWFRTTRTALDRGRVLSVAADITDSLLLRATSATLNATAPPNVHAVLRAFVTGTLPPRLLHRVARVLADRPRAPAP